MGVAGVVPEIDPRTSGCRKGVAGDLDEPGRRCGRPARAQRERVHVGDDDQLVPGRADRSFAEHSAIVDGVARGDGDAAEAAMRTHLGHVTDALRSAHA